MATCNSLVEFTDALYSLARAPSDILDESACVIEIFVTPLYDKTSQCTDLNKHRKKLFATPGAACEGGSLPR